MSRTVKHPPKPDRFTRRDRTGKHAAASIRRRIERAEWMFDAVASVARSCGGREIEGENTVRVLIDQSLR